jgi:DNA-binding helix-hairpin-helix protein with protein kinase domain
VIEHLACLLLARIDGKSPVEYITDPDEKETIRRMARNFILRPPRSIAEVFAC